MKNQKIFNFFKKTLRKMTFRLITFIFICALLVAGSFTYWLFHLPSQYSGETAEAIIVLTGGSGRLKAGAMLLKDKKADALLISGVNVRLSDKGLFKQMPVLDRKLKKDVSIGREAENTRGNAIEAKQWMAENNYDTAIIVTSYWHMERAMLEFSHIMEDKEFIAYPVLTDDYLSKGRYGYLSKDMLLLLFKEYCKLNMRKLQLLLTDD